MSLSCVAHFESYRREASVVVGNFECFSFTHACVWLLFLLVNPAGREQADYLFIDVWRSAYPHGIYTNSFATPFLTGSLFILPSYMYWSSFLFRSVSTVVVPAVWGEEGNTAACKKSDRLHLYIWPRAQAQSNHSRNRKNQIHLLPVGRAAAWELEKLSHYLFPKITVVTWCVFVWYHKDTL